MKDLVVLWANQIGTKKAISRLIDENGPDLSPSVAEKLVHGRYHAELGFEKGHAVLKEMSKDGFTLSDDNDAA